MEVAAKKAQGAPVRSSYPQGVPPERWAVSYDQLMKVNEQVMSLCERSACTRFSKTDVGKTVKIKGNDAFVGYCTVPRKVTWSDLKHRDLAGTIKTVEEVRNGKVQLHSKECNVKECSCEGGQEFENPTCKLEDYATVTMREVNEMFIKPECAKSGTSYAMACNPGGLELHMFVTHAWDEPFKEFVESIQSACAHDAVKPNLWICALALVQSDDPAVISAQVGDEKTPLEQAPFVRALERASQFLVVRNRNTDIYTRLWCVCELDCAWKFDLLSTGKARVCGPAVFAGATSKCCDAECYSPTDREKIL